MRMSLKVIFEEAGHSIAGMAGTGTEAIKLYRELKPSLITLDINMEGMDGISVLKILMEEFPKPVVLMISADKQKATEEYAQRLGAAGFIKKPFNPKEIASQLKKIFASTTLRP